MVALHRNNETVSAGDTAISLSISAGGGGWGRSP